MSLFGAPSQRAEAQGPNSTAVNNSGAGNVFIGESKELAAARHAEQMEMMRGMREDIARKNGVAPKVLIPLFEHLGQSGLTLDEMRSKAPEAVDAILAQARQPVARSNDGADIDATIGAARARLGKADTAGTLAILADKIAEEETARRQRLVPLLTEKATVERLSYDYAAAKATLRQLLAVDPDRVWDWIELGDLLVTTGAVDEALAAFRQGLAAAERLAHADPGDTHRQRNIGVGHSWIGDMQVAQGELGAALGSYRAYLAIAERLAQSDPGNAGWQRDLSVSHNKIGDAQRAQGDLAAALRSYQASLAIRERLAQSDPGNAGWQRDLSVSHNKIGDVQQAQGDLAAALRSYQASQAIFERLAQSDPGNAGWQRDLSVSHNKIGDVQQARGDLAAALRSYQASLAIRERLAQSDPGNAGWQRDLSVSQDKIGDVRQAQGDLAAALRSYQASLAIAERLAQSDPGNAGWQRDLAISHERLGAIWQRRGETAQAIAAYEKALYIYRDLQARQPDDTPSLVFSVVPLRQLSRLKGRDGRADLEAALAILVPLAAADRLDANRRGWIAAIRQELAALDG